MNDACSAAVFSILCVLAVLSAEVSHAEEAAILRGADWLLTRQRDDGSWRSETYGQMRSGVANTALVVDTLTRMPAAWRRQNQAALERGFAFLPANLDDDGYLSASNHSADFPTFATALALTAIERACPQEWKAEQRRMRSYLLRVQRLDPEDRDGHGGWAQIGGEVADSVAETNVNISVSRFVAEALNGDEALPGQPRQAALGFLDRCRNPNDGGYFFTPAADDPLNKAGQVTQDSAASYGTATADALLTQLAWRVPRSDPALQSALRWLEAQPFIAVVPGIAGGDQAIVGADEALKYYWWAALAKIMSAFPDSTLAERKSELHGLLLREQQRDGSWRNSNSLMREDDPLVATAFAVGALIDLK